MQQKICMRPNIVLRMVASSTYFRYLVIPRHPLFCGRLTICDGVVAPILGPGGDRLILRNKRYEKPSWKRERPWITDHSFSSSLSVNTHTHTLSLSLFLSLFPFSFSQITPPFAVMAAVTFDGNDTLSLPAGRDFDGTANLTCLDYSDFRQSSRLFLFDNGNVSFRF